MIKHRGWLAACDELRGICDTAAMRGASVLLAGSLITSGCAVNSYQISTSELQRLAQIAPNDRRIADLVETLRRQIDAAPR